MKTRIIEHVSMFLKQEGYAIKIVFLFLNQPYGTYTKQNRFIAKARHICRLIHE